MMNICPVIGGDKGRDKKEREKNTVDYSEPCKCDVK